MEVIGGFSDHMSLGDQKNPQAFAKVGMGRTVVEIQLKSQESYLETMFDGADEGVVSEHEKLNGRGA